MDLNKLFEMIGEVIDARGPIHEDKPVDTKEKKTLKGIPYPRLALNKNWGTPDSDDRIVLDRFVAEMPGDLKQKIISLESFLEGCKEECINAKNIPQAIASIVILDALASLVFDFNARPAGDLFEAFLAALTGEEQTGQSGQISDVGTTLSTKLIRKGTDVTGSYKSLERFLKTNKSVTYLVAAKAQEKKGGPLSLEFYQFEIPKNIVPDPALVKDGQFVIPAETYENKEFLLGTLNIGTQAELRNIAQEYLNNLDEKITIIYETLGTMSNQLNNYFVDNDTNSAEQAKASAALLKTNVDNLA
tara:strand:+ start:599 stop:1507 length:909 start_codon:yes stop_codon:yes gene_type:complete